MKIDLCYQGWIRGVEITKVTNANGELVDISDMYPTEVTDKLNHGELFVSLGDLLYNGEDEDLEMHDFQVTQ